MEHDAIREALLAGEITSVVTAHLDECPDCAALAADLRMIDELAPSLKASVTAPTDFVAKTMARFVEGCPARHSPPVHDDAIREALLAGEITPVVTAHLDECPDCAALAADLRMIDELAPSFKASVTVPADFVAKALARIVEDRETRDRTEDLYVREDSRRSMSEGSADREPSGAGFLTLLSNADLDALVALGRLRRYRHDAMLFSEGDHSRHVIVILAGRARLWYLTPEGRKIFLTTKGTGEILGELSAIDGSPRSATATTVGPAEVLLIEGVDFVAFIKARPRAALLLLGMLSDRLWGAKRHQVEFGALDTFARVARQLDQLARTSDGAA